MAGKKRSDTDFPEAGKGVSTMRVRPIPMYLGGSRFEPLPDGSLIVRPTEPLGRFPGRLTERLEHWAARAPDRLFLARRAGHGWHTVSYAQALRAARAIGQALLDRGLSLTRPVLILSGNGIEHGLLSLACLHVGVPFVPVSTAYSLLATDFARLRAIAALVRPGLIFADDGSRYAAAIRACAPEDAEVVLARGDPGVSATPFDALLATTPTPAVQSASRAVHPGTVAKLLFTSGSTGVPKAVINTHGMLCSTAQMLRTAYPALAEEPPVLVDWLPWNHVLGGTCNFGLTLFNGGALYIDDGQPVPGRIEETVRNLREVAPLFYFSVPRGYEELVPWLRRDRKLRESFFSRVRMLQYAGASIAQPVCDAIDELAMETVGERIQWVTMLGSTEAGPISLYWHSQAAPAGKVGLPVPGVTLKLTPTDGQLEARVQSPSVTPGYWRRDDLTAAVFDEEGFLRTGDALAWVDAGDRPRGFRYNGRIAEDFKLATGTWVRVGPLRDHLLKHLAPEVRDVVVAGENRNYVAVLALASRPGLAQDSKVRARLRTRLASLAAAATGSAQRVLRFAFVDAKQLSRDAGDLTDKGTLSQRNILRNHAPWIDELYADVPLEHIISLNGSTEVPRDRS
jgi:feruloyl-CoA synthase